jgi:hypothetical protein
MSAAAKVLHINEPTNGGSETIAHSEPYTVFVEVEGSCDLLFHRWNAEAVDEKAKAGKNSRAKKTDNVESYVYRNDNGEICIPGDYFRGSIINAAKFRQDPRSPRKSAMDLYKAGIVVTTLLCSLGTKEWDYLDRRRAPVQRQGINRTRPAMRSGWKAKFQVLVLLPEYIDRHMLRETIEAAGRLVGVADYRPTFGRFGVTSYK